MKGLFVIAGLVLLAAMLSGTPSKPAGNPLDQRVVELATRHAEQQAMQSRQMAELQRQWQTERTDLNQQRNRLETERQEIALQRQREPIIAQSIQQLEMLALCLVPLVVCALLLRKANEPEDGNAIAETLVSDLMSAKPTLFAPALPAPTADAKPVCHPARNPPTPANKCRRSRHRAVKTKTKRTLSPRTGGEGWSGWRSERPGPPRERRAGSTVTPDHARLHPR